MLKCKHVEARIVSLDPDRAMINVYCPCGTGWVGSLKPWYSQRGILHRPPKWVSRMAQGRLGAPK